MAGMYFAFRRSLHAIGYCAILSFLGLVTQSCATISQWNSQTALPQATPAGKQTATLNVGKIESSIQSSSVKPKTKTVQRGEASWYGPGFRGKKTASGDSFDQTELTAAHKTFPLGSKAKVTNLKNGNTVEVEIKDRGPFVEGRIIDLSKAAAEKLGMIGSGTALVQVELLFESVRSDEPVRASKD